MTDARRLILLLPLPLGLFLLPALEAQDGPAVGKPPGAPAVERSGYLGVASCAAFACHGGNGPDGDHRSAYLTWMARDPHARAWLALAGRLSADIEARLAGNSGREPLRAERDQRCLTCHASPVAVRESSTVRRAGVDCETCHGPASRWLEPHSLPAWKALSGREKSAHGMTPTRDLVPRAILCARCHVGSPESDVDHDLIAAGHPRLNFELVSYLDALPKHWDAARERSTLPDFDARAWAIGQVVCAREALAVLSARARKGAWPEFAEYSCSACHHALDGGLDPSPTGRSPESLGSLRWGTWYFAMAGVLGGHGDSDRTEATPLARLQRLMDGPSPAPSDAERIANEARGQLDSWIGLHPSRPSLGPDELRALLSRIKQAALEPSPMCWDRGAQARLAVSAVTRSLERQGHRPDPAARTALQDMLRAIEPPGSDERDGDRHLNAFRRALERYQP